MNVTSEVPKEPNFVITVTRKEALLFSRFVCPKSCGDYQAAMDFLSALLSAIQKAIQRATA